MSLLLFLTYSADYFQQNLEHFLVRKVSFIRRNGRLFATLDLLDEFSFFAVLIKEVSEYLNTVKVHGFIFFSSRSSVCEN